MKCFPAVMVIDHQSNNILCLSGSASLFIEYKNLDRIWFNLGYGLSMEKVTVLWICHFYSLLLPPWNLKPAEAMVRQPLQPRSPRSLEGSLWGSGILEPSHTTKKEKTIVSVPKEEDEHFI